MDQNGMPMLDPNQSDPQKVVQQPPVDKQDAKRVEFIRARIFLFILIFLLPFNTNPYFTSIITIMLAVLALNIFDPIFGSILKILDWLLILPFKPLEWGWHLLFVDLLKPFRHWFTGHMGPWFIRHRQFVIIVVTFIITVVTLASTTLQPLLATTSGKINDSVCLYTHLPWFTCDSGLGVTTLPLSNLDGIHIGLVADNTYGPFDQSVLNADEQDVEDLIFKEKQRACTGQHITLVVVTMLSRTVGDPLNSSRVGLQDLEGSYLAQQAYNVSHPAISICLAIANLGTAETTSKESSLVKSHPDDYSLPQVIHQIAQLAHTDPSFRGIVGFAFSQQVKDVLDLIRGYQDLSAIPIISPAASSDELSDISNFYRIVSPDHSQGTALAQFFCDSLIQSQPSDSIAMLTDSSNAYSRSLQSAFSDAVNCGDPTHRTTITYTIGDHGSIQQAVDQVLNQPEVKYIFFSGYDEDMATVVKEIHQVRQEHASDITIIGGDGLNSVGDTVQYSYNRVYATDFTDPLLTTNSVAQSFIRQGFPQSPFANAIPSHLWIPSEILETYDAVNAFAQTAKKWQSGDLTQSNFNNTLGDIRFKGVSGNEVAFQGSRTNGYRSDPNQGYIYITCIDYAHNIHLITRYYTINDGSGPAQNVPLSQADGASKCS